jgi:outer membrane protein OmpA-like peptidoglycan-associated protein
MSTDNDSGGRWSDSSSTASTTVTRVEAYRKRAFWPLLLGPAVLIPGLIETNSRIEDDLTKKTKSALGAELVSVDYSAQDATLCTTGDFDAAYEKVKALTGAVKVERGDDCASAPAAAPPSTAATSPPAEPTTSSEAAATTTAPPTTTAASTTTTAAEAGSALAARAEFDGASITLTGVVDSQDQRDAIVRGAVAAMGGDESKVTDEMTIAGSPAGDAVSAADEQAGNLATLLNTLPPNFASGEAGVDGSLYLRGVYLDDEAKASAEADAASAGVADADIDIEPRPTATANDRDQLIADINALFVDTTIQFEQSSANILPESDELLDEAAARLKQFDLTGIVITIEGHTDGDGAESFNQDLSQRRAEAVERALVERGVTGDALNPVGFGESRPVAPNDTPENKALNRRVQFSAEQ